MYSYIKGTVEEINLDYIVIDNNNIGYKINVSSNTIKDLHLGNMAKIYTKLIVREDDMSLCGFATKEEMKMFELLTSVSKIGPKVGLSILSFASPGQLGAYILSEDVAKLSKAPGVGKKTAERIVLELKDKVDKNNVENTLYELLLGEAEAKDTIVKDVVENVDLIPSNVNLSGAEIELIGVDEKEYIMKKIIDKVRRKYDYIIMDCPPSLNMLTINALTAANSVLVPIQCEYYALEGLSQLIHTIELVKERLNKKLVMEGVVFTMYDARTNLSLQVVENVKDNLQQNIYKTIIPRNVRLAEAPSYGQPITLYDTRSAGAEAYRLLAEEVINREGE